MSPFVSGPLNGSNDSITSASPNVTWSLDSVGNWKSRVSGSITQTRTHDAENQITGITITGGGWTNPTYDADGNTTKNNVNTTFTYDAWNRTAVINDGTTSHTFDYDAIHRRVREATANVGGGGEESGGDSLNSPTNGEGVDAIGDPVGDGSDLSSAAGGHGDNGADKASFDLNSLTYPSTGKDFYYNTNWQMLEEAHAGETKYQYVWSATYIDALMLRDEDKNSDGITTDSSDQRLWAQHDANYNVTSVMLDDSSANVVQRFTFDPYGAPTFLTASWSSGSAATYSWVYLAQGGRYDAVGLTYVFRLRDQSVSLGRWMQNDPLGYVDGANAYELLHSHPVRSLDPLGLKEFKDELRLYQSLDGDRITVDPIQGGKFDLGPAWTPKFKFEHVLTGDYLTISPIISLPLPILDNPGGIGIGIGAHSGNVDGEVTGAVDSNGDWNIGFKITVKF